MSVARTVARPSVAASVTVCKLVTARVVIGKSTEFLPNGTWTDVPGSFTLALSLAIAMLRPPAGALPKSVTVPVRFRPPRIDEDSRDSATSCAAPAGSISSVAISVTPLPEAAIVASVVEVTTAVFTAVWAEALPGGTASCAITGAAALLVCSPTR